MPKYVYKCKSCDQHFEVYHGMSEEQGACIFCPTKDLVRVPQMPHISREIKSEGGKAGDKVKAAIEENRAILEEAKKDARSTLYGEEK